MGFLQGIIADARPAASVAVTDVNQPVITGGNEKINLSLSGGIASGKTGMQENDFGEFSGSGVTDSGRGISQVDRQMPAVSAPGVETTHASRHDSITIENSASVSGNDDQNRATLSVNVEYHGVGLQESYPAETTVNPEAELSTGGYIEASANIVEPSTNYSEPSVFSVMPSEAHDAFQYDSLPSDTPLLSGHDQTHFNSAAHEETVSESLSHADGVDHYSSESVSSPTARPVRQEISRPLVAEHTIESGHSGHTITLDKHELPGTRAGSVDASSVQLTCPDSIRGENIHPPSSGNQEAKQPGELTSSGDLSQPIPAQEIAHPSPGKTKLSFSTVLSRRSTLPHENKQIPFNATTEVSAVQDSITQVKVSEAKDNNNNTPPPEVNGLQRQAAITTDSKRVVFQTKTSVNRRDHQQPARKPDSSFIPSSPEQKVPEVKIGQVDVFIEAPRKKADSARGSHKIPQAFSSRNYLRRI